MARRAAQPPTARVVRGAGGPVAAFVANAKPKVAAARVVGAVFVRVAMTLGAFSFVVMLVASGTSTRDRPSWQRDYRVPKYYWDAQQFHRMLQLQMQTDAAARQRMLDQMLHDLQHRPTWPVHVPGRAQLP